MVDFLGAQLDPPPQMWTDKLIVAARTYFNGVLAIEASPVGPPPPPVAPSSRPGPPSPTPPPRACSPATYMRDVDLGNARSSAQLSPPYTTAQPSSAPTATGASDVRASPTDAQAPRLSSIVAPRAPAAASSRGAPGAGQQADKERVPSKRSAGDGDGGDGTRVRSLSLSLSLFLSLPLFFIFPEAAVDRPAPTQAEKKVRRDDYFAGSISLVPTRPRVVNGYRLHNVYLSTSDDLDNPDTVREIISSVCADSQVPQNLLDSMCVRLFALLAPL